MVRDANVPPTARRIPETSIAYYTRPLGAGFNICAYGFRANGAVRYTEDFGTPGNGGRYRFMLWGQVYELAAKDVESAAVPFSVDPSAVIVPARASRASQAAATARWRAKVRGDYTASNLPSGYTYDPIVLPERAYRVLNGGNTVEVLTYSLARVSAPAKHTGDNGVKITYHPLVNGTTVIAKRSVRLADDGKTLVAWARELMGPSVPHRVFTPDPIAQSYFDDTPVPPGFKALPGARAWYRVEWAKDAAGGLILMYAVAWSAAQARDLAARYAVDTPTMTLRVCNVTYEVSRDFSLALPRML